MISDASQSLPLLAFLICERVASEEDTVITLMRL